MRYAEFSTKEGRGIIKLPIDIKGKRNGDVKLTLAVKSEYENPAVDEKNVYLTTHTIVVYPEDTFYNVEVTIVDDKDMNEPRYCDVAIVAAEGATITTPSFTKVETRTTTANLMTAAQANGYSIRLMILESLLKCSSISPLLTKTNLDIRVTMLSIICSQTKE